MNSVRNVLAITEKELRSYFASPIAYIIIGLFSLLFGWFFYVYLTIFVRQSEQMMQMGGGGNANINQQMIRYVLLNVAVILLFLMPVITMRTYSEEKRSGTIELLVTLLYMAILFWFGNPEWRPVAAGYLGLLLMGGCFISVGLLISSLTKNQIVAGALTFAVFLMLWVVNWMADQSGPITREILTTLSITDHFDDFARGVIDTKHLIYYLSFITFGLFLTAKSVDSERWRG